MRLLKLYSGMVVIFLLVLSVLWMMLEFEFLNMLVMLVMLLMEVLCDWSLL